MLVSLDHKSATETAITIIIHKNVGKALPCQNIFIALSWCSFSTSTAVCRPPLLPFHTVITHLYTRQALCPREVREKKTEWQKEGDVYIFSFSSSISYSCSSCIARVHPRNELRARSRTHFYFGQLNKKVKKKPYIFHAK